MPPFDDFLKKLKISDNTHLTLEEQKALIIKYKALVLENNRNKAFWESTNKNLEKVTLALDDANQKLKNLTLTDPLTQLRNRRYFNDVVSKNINNFLKLKTLSEIQKRDLNVKNKVIGIFLIDIDSFKKINDSYGHNSGDIVLQEVSKTFLSIIRFDDICIRWGGEEFLIILDKTNIEYLSIFAKKCKKRIKEKKIKIKKNKFINISVSIGYIAYPFYEKFPNILTFEQCIIICDHALYLAKKKGKNKNIGIYENKIPVDYSKIINILSLYKNDNSAIDEYLNIYIDN